MKKCTYVLFLALLTLGGCQQRPPVATLPVESQLAQLSALVAAGSWLRQNCNRSDIPADDVLSASALALAAERGWRLAPDIRQPLSQRVASRLSALDADTPAQAEKCAGLNQAAAPFLGTVQRGSS